MAKNLYRFRDGPDNFRANTWAALLGAGRGSVVVRRSALAAQQMDGWRADEPIDIYNRYARTRATLFVPSRALVLPEQVTLVDGLPCSDPLTTIAQVGDVVEDDRVEQAVEWFLRSGGSYEELVGRLGHAGSNGLLALRRVLAVRPPALPFTHSELETRFWQLIRSDERLRAELPDRQVPIVDPDTGRTVFYLDNAWLRLLLYVELDGVAAHSPAGAIYRDRWRLNTLTAMLGLRPLHYTWRDVVYDPRRVLFNVRQALETAKRTVAAA